MGSIFARLDEKRNLQKMFEKIFKNFEKFSSENCEKCIILAYFSKEFNKQGVNLLRVWTKNPNCWEILRKF